jgi:hypothetical protein
MTIYCVSHGQGGFWAFSPAMLKSFAPKEYLTPSKFSSGRVWEASLEDLDTTLWAFSPVTSLVPSVVVGTY